MPGIYCYLMGLIKNYDELAITPQRKIVLDLIESALQSIQAQKVFQKSFSLHGHILKISEKEIDLSKFASVFILGFGKGSAKIATSLEKLLGENLNAGYVIDASPEEFSKIEFTLGTHPLPSQANIDFTNRVVDKFSNLSQKDLVLVITCGGGSVMFEKPHNLTLDQMIEVNKVLLHSGADISEMNVVRKHLDVVKGGGLAQIMYPANVVNLIFSDVPGNDLSVIASGPLVLDPTSDDDAAKVIEKYNLSKQLTFAKEDFIESPKDPKYFEGVTNILILSNQTALVAMQKKATGLGVKSRILTNHFQSDANDAAVKLIEKALPGTILLAGGETSLKVTGSGEGGRNQQLALSALSKLDSKTLIASFDSDGWDNSPYAGAIADFQTLKKASDLNLEPETYLNSNDSLNFFRQVGCGIETGRLPSNVSDLMIVFKND